MTQLKVSSTQTQIQYEKCMDIKVPFYEKFFGCWDKHGKEYNECMNKAWKTAYNECKKLIGENP